MNIVEYSFIAFDDFPAIKQSRSKQVVLMLPEYLRNSGVDVVYAQVAKMAAVDAGVCVKNIHKGLSDRISTFPRRKQVLVHLFDNLTGSNYLIQEKARNEASFTTDIRNYAPKGEPIHANTLTSHTLTSEINTLTLLPYLSSYRIELLNHEKLYLDNYTYYLSLLHGIHSHASSILIYIPSNIDILDNLQFVKDLCIGISSLIIS